MQYTPGGRLFASPLRVPLSLIRKEYRRTSFCVTLKGATISYPQGYQAGAFFSFFYFFFLLFRRSGEHSWCFPTEKSEIRTLFHDFDTRISLNGSGKWMERENTEGRITALLSLTSEPAIFPEPKDGNLRRRGFKGTSERLFSTTLMDEHVSVFFSEFLSAFFSGYSWHKGGQLNVGRYDHLIFVIFIGILWRKEGRVRRTVSYADTVLQAHVQAKASAAT